MQPPIFGSVKLNSWNFCATNSGKATDSKESPEMFLWHFENYNYRERQDILTCCVCWFSFLALMQLYLETKLCCCYWFSSFSLDIYLQKQSRGNALGEKSIWKFFQINCEIPVPMSHVNKVGGLASNFF